MQPRIAVINHASIDIGVSFSKLVTALRYQVVHHWKPAWGFGATLTTAKEIPADHWALVLLDDADAANALGYHETTPSGMPIGKVFVKTTLDYGEKPSVTASHELLEILADPLAVLLTATNRDDTLWAYESCDAVQDQSYEIKGVSVSNFVTPEWFEDFAHLPGTKFDYLGSLTAPFTLTNGGYMPVFKNGQWTQIYGSLDMERKHAMKRAARAADPTYTDKGRIRRVVTMPIGT